MKQFWVVEIDEKYLFCSGLKQDTEMDNNFSLEDND